VLTTALIFVPVAGAVLLWLLPFPARTAASFALLVALGEVALWIAALQRFDFDQAGLQFDTEREWSSDLHASYHVGMYGFSLWLVGMTVVVGAAAVAYAFWVGRERARAYFGLALFLTGSIVGVFTAQDLLLFYVFFETMLIPLYVLIGVWGGPGRLGATLKFIIYTVAGSLLMLVAIIALGLTQDTFDLTNAATSSNEWLFLGFVAAFAVKAPLFPLHGWLPDAYRESSPEIAAVLSGVVSKVAVYGFLRIAITKFPEPVDDFQWVLLTLGAVTLVYGALVAFRAPDVRGVIAYSSMSQMGLITLGLFALNDSGFDGAVLQMVNHGLVSGALFLLAGTIERRTSTGDFALLGGMAKGRPALATVLMTTGIIALAVPGATTFAGEFLILLGVFKVGWGWAVVGAAAIVFAAMYMLRLISAVLHQERGPAVPDEALDLRPGELAIIVPLVACLLALSVWPAAITERSFADDRPRDAVVTQFASLMPVGPFAIVAPAGGDAPDVMGPNP
jgi:NADH-quinone oxidoreductase subunit M